MEKEELITIKQSVKTFGFYDIKIDPTLDLFYEIEKLKKEKNAVLLAHYYQDSDIQDIADFIGDSLKLAQVAKQTNAEIILFAGVHFMAETAKILNPSKKVILPDYNAGCSLSDSCPEDVFKKFKEKHNDHKVISYINCSAGIKTLSDIICTSSNAKTIIESFPKEQKLIFAPDRNLGAYLNKITKREMLLWNGACLVHENFNLEKIIKTKEQNKKAKIIAHPECDETILKIADFIGSTSALLKFTKTDKAEEFIVVTEAGIIHQMEKENPGKRFIPAPTNNNCACNNCPYMKLNTLEKIYLCLKYELPEILLEEKLRAKAETPILKMLEISKKTGL